MRKGDAAQAVGGKQDGAPSAPVWRDSILKADTALEQATTIQRSVQYRMELENEIRVLRAALKEAHAQAGHYQGLHARLSAEKAASVTGYARELACLQTENDTLRLRHRVYKIMAQYYALFVLRIPPRAMAEHRERVLQHVLFQRRKGHTLADIRATEVISGLLAAGDGAAPPENPRPAMDPDTAWRDRHATYSTDGPLWRAEHRKSLIINVLIRRAAGLSIHESIHPGICLGRRSGALGKNKGAEAPLGK